MRFFTMDLAAAGTEPGGLVLGGPDGHGEMRFGDAGPPLQTSEERGGITT